MAEPTAVPKSGGGLRTPARSKYARWDGLAAFPGPLLALAANMYGIWETRTHGTGAEGVIEASTTTPYIAFGGVRLLGGTLLVFGLVVLYAYQVEAAGRLGLIGFVVSMLGTVLLTAQAWFLFFVAPALAAEAPAFIELALAGEVGPLLNAGLFIPVITQAIGWTIFGIATYRAGSSLAVPPF